jgi:serine/threonine-protein kinase
VLPFSSDADGEDPELANGMTAELIDALSMTTRLRVHPHAATARFVDHLGDPVSAGRELGVDAVVVGSFRRTAAGFRVSARVISVHQGFQLWARRFDCQTRDLLAVTDEIAHAIASALSTSMPVPARKPADDGAAVSLYLRARAVVRTGWHLPEAFAPAVDLIDRAFARAPHDPTILAGWAIIHARNAFLATGGDHEEELARARAAAERVVTASPHIAEAWIALATVRWLSHDNVGLVRAIAGALDASPSNARAHDMLGRLLLEHGAPDAGIARLEHALVLDPAARDIRFEIARAPALARRWDLCEALFELPVDESTGAPHAVFGARYAVWRGVRDPSWRSPTAKYVAAQPGRMFTLFSAIVQRGVVDPDALAALEEYVDSSPRLAALIHQIRVEVHLAVGDVDRAFAAFDDALASGLVDLTWVDRLPLADGVRASDPRWAEKRVVVAERVAPAIAVARELGLLRGQNANPNVAPTIGA